MPSKNQFYVPAPQTLYLSLHFGKRAEAGAGVAFSSACCMQDNQTSLMIKALLSKIF